MRKIVLLAMLATMLAARPAEACRGSNPCPLVVDLMAYSLGAAVVGGYAYGTGYFIYHDVKDETQTLKYGGAELAYNGAFAALFVPVAADAAIDGEVGTAVVFGALGITHATLAAHGAYRIKTEWKDPGRAPDNTREWIAGIAYGANTLVWTLQLPDRHDRTYGIAEASVNTPIALGLGYLAFDRARDRERGAALLYGGMALASGALAYHGIRTAIDPDDAPGIDLLGTDVMPTTVSDGHQIAPGVSMSGSW